MLLNFEEIEEKVVPHMRGGEGEMITRMFVNEDTKIMRGRLTPGSTVGVYEPLSAGSVHYCPKGHEHSLINDGDEDLVILAMIPSHGA